MSTSLLAVGASAVFLAVFAIAYSVQSIVAERRQVYRTLQAIRAVELRPTDLRNRELARPARERLLKPFYNAALTLARRFTPAGAREGIRRKLIMAGSPFGWDPDRVLVAKVVCLAGGMVLGLLFLAVAGFAWPLRAAGFVAISTAAPAIMASPTRVVYSGARNRGLSTSRAAKITTGRIDRIRLDSRPSAERARICRFSE